MYTLYILHIRYIGYLGQSPLSDIFYSHDIFDILQRLVTIGKKRGIYIYIAKLSLPASKGWVALSSLVRRSPSSFVRRVAWHLHLSPLYDVLDHTNHRFSESSWFKDIKIDITKCLIHKYTNTNTQIHKYSIWRSARKTINVAYFWNVKDIKNYIPMCQTRKYKKYKYKIHKYTNIAYDEVLERSSMWYIFEKRIVQGYQK